MKFTMARYTVKPEKLKEVKKAIAEVTGEIRRHEPRTLYLVFREESATSFIHLMSFENEAAERKHSQSRYVDRFVKKLYPSCVGKPVFTEFDLLASTKKQWVLEK